MPRFKTTDAIALAAFMALAIALPVPAQTLPDNFNTLDANADAVVDFEEFAAFATQQGDTPTHAAQTFITLTHGNPVMTPADFLYGLKIAQSPTWNHGYDIAASSDAFDETDTSFDAPYKPQGRILDITPNEEVAGELIRRFEAVRFDDDVI